MEPVGDKQERLGTGLMPSPTLTPRACAPPAMASLSLPAGQPARATATVPTATVSCQCEGLLVTSRIPVTCGADGSGGANSPHNTAFRRDSRGRLFPIRRKSLKLPHLTRQALTPSYRPGLIRSEPIYSAAIISREQDQPPGYCQEQEQTPPAARVFASRSQHHP